MAEQKEQQRGTVGIHVDRRTKGKSTQCVLAASLWRTFEEYPRAGCAQIFTHGPRTKGRAALDEDEVRAVAAGYRLYQHTTYMTCWKDEAASNKHIQDQMTCAAELGLQGIVLHLAKEPPSTHIAVMRKIEQKRRWQPEYAPAGDREWCRFILEMRAIKSGKWAYQEATEVNALCAALREAGYGPDRVWICLDTAHLAAGGISLRTAAAADRYICALEYPDYIGLLHLNGNTYNPDERAGDHHCIPHCADDWVWHKRASTREIEPPSLADSGATTLARWFVARDRDVILEQDHSAELVEFYKRLTALLE